ncbi:hypothetical protein KDAU_32710 [Dictyobacter aurantiacus]|uniref:Uncharacterized protein n=1 Tax=Dictyobacter aurantiacus TaxID=1936993 RepID=A0A401ZGF9_9CHLR|nr:hypothetical protein KDAU_32710 [Dictyobacter aurantiacus]
MRVQRAFFAPAHIIKTRAVAYADARAGALWFPKRWEWRPFPALDNPGVNWHNRQHERWKE